MVHIAYHGIKKVNYGSNKNFAAGIYSIVDGNVSLVINSNKNDYVKMKLTDIIGRVIFTESYLINSGANIKSIRLNSGVYVLQLVNSAGEKISSKIIVQ